MRKLAGLCVAVVAALGAPSAGAAVLLSDDFDAEPVPAPANWVANYAGFANFSVEEGTVDLLGPGNPFGLTGSGNFVDLDGSTRDGGFLQTAEFGFDAGDLVTLSLLVGGNQRGGADRLFGGFVFSGPAVTYADVALSGFTGAVEADIPLQVLLGDLPSLASGAGYSTYSISFRATSAGSLSAVVGTTSDDNVGPLLDGFVLSAIGAPEPAGWAMMILGFGGMGSVLRARRRTAAA